MQQKINSKSIYVGSIFTVSSDQVRIENGRIATRDIVHHHGGVGVLAIRENAILFVRQYRYAIGKDLYEIPAGKLEQNEDPYTCGMRELEEESGYTCERMETICAMYSTPGFCSEQIHLYEAIGLHKAKNPLPMDEDECITAHWIPLKDAAAMLQNGTIQDAKTIIAVQYALLKHAIVSV